MFKKRVAELRKCLYEYDATDTTSFRFQESEDVPTIRKKVKYLQKHIKNHHDMGKVRQTYI